MAVPAPGGPSVRTLVARGAAINAAFFAGIGALGMVRTFVLAALLSRADFGLWGIVSISLGTLLWLRQVGVADRYVQQKESDQVEAFQRAFTVELLLALVTTVVLCATIPVWVAVYGRSDFVWPALAVIACVPAAAFQAPIWIHYRAMRFGRQRALQAVEPLLATVVMIVLAAAGAGWESFAVGIVVGAWAGAAAAIVASPMPLALRVDRSVLSGYWRFSAPLFLSVLGALVLSQTAVIATEAHLGLAAAGAVTLAAAIAAFTDRVDQLVTGAMYPAICAVSDRLDLLRESLLKSNRLALLWAGPFGVAVALFADDLVRFGLGERWEPAVALLQVWGLVAAVGHIGFNWDAYFRARADTWPIAIASLAAMVTFLAVGLPLLLTEGLEGLAIAVGAQMAVHVACRGVFLRRLFGRVGFLRHGARALAPAVGAGLLVLAVRAAEAGPRTAGMAVAELAGFLVVTAAAAWWLERVLIREAVGYLAR